MRLLALASLVTCCALAVSGAEKKEKEKEKEAKKEKKDAKKDAKKTVDPYLVYHSEPVLVGRGTAQSHFWRPEGYTFGTNKTLVRVSRSDATDCGCDADPSSVHGRTAPCFKPCAPPADFSTLDGGLTFQEVEDSADFCGYGSVLFSGTRLCVRRDEAGVNGLVFDKYTLGNHKLQKTVEYNVSFAFPEGLAWEDIEFGPSGMHYAHIGWLIAEAGVPVLYTNVNHTMHKWNRVGPVIESPVDNLRDASVMFKKDDLLVATLRMPSGVFAQTQTRTMGRVWSQPEVIPTAAPHVVPRQEFTHYTSLTVNTGFVPTVQYVRDRQKRYSRHNFTLTDKHNIYSSEYTEANPKELARCNKEPYSKFCESSGVVSFAPDDIYPPGSLQNITRFLMCYDRLANGFTGPALPAKDEEAPRVDEVYCAMMAVNDTTVANEAAERSKEHAKREEERKAEQEERERKKEAQEEAKEKAAENKAAAWNEVYMAYVTEAQRFEEEDGELVVVMDFIDEFKEFYE